MCGKNHMKTVFILQVMGSPPHVREKPEAQVKAISEIRITPACAGKTYV